MKEQTMEERFDKEFEETNEQLYLQYGEALNLIKVKEFVNSEIDLALKSQQERLVEEIEKILEEPGKDTGHLEESFTRKNERQRIREIIKKTYV